MYIHRKFLLIVIQVSDLLMKPCQTALMEMKRGFPVGRRPVVASGYLLLPAKGALVSDCVQGVVAAGSATRPCLALDVVMVANHTTCSQPLCVQQMRVAATALV